MKGGVMVCAGLIGALLATPALAKDRPPKDMAACEQRLQKLTKMPDEDRGSVHDICRKADMLPAVPEIERCFKELRPLVKNPASRATRILTLCADQAMWTERAETLRCALPYIRDAGYDGVAAVEGCLDVPEFTTQAKEILPCIQGLAAAFQANLGDAATLAPDGQAGPLVEICKQAETRAHWQDAVQCGRDVAPLVQSGVERQAACIAPWVIGHKDAYLACLQATGPLGLQMNELREACLDEGGIERVRVALQCTTALDDTATEVSLQLTPADRTTFYSACLNPGIASRAEEFSHCNLEVLAERVPPQPGEHDRIDIVQAVQTTCRKVLGRERGPLLKCVHTNRSDDPETMIEALRACTLDFKSK